MSEDPHGQGSAEERVRDAVKRFRAKGLRARKSFGQNFSATRVLPGASPSWQRRLGGTVVEIGAGLGALTSHLVDRASCVFAVERDRDLCPLLRETFEAPIDEGRLEIVEADAKQVAYAQYFVGRPAPHVLAGNLPFQLTGPLLRIGTELASVVHRIVFMVQREVANRLMAAPDTEDYGALTVFVTAAFDVARALDVKRGAFHPVPGVDATVVVLTPLRPPHATETDTFRALVAGAFGGRRKTLRNAWARIAHRDKLENAARASCIDLGARGETLSVADFARMATILEHEEPNKPPRA